MSDSAWTPPRLRYGKLTQVLPAGGNGGNKSDALRVL